MKRDKYFRVNWGKRRIVSNVKDETWMKNVRKKIKKIWEKGRNFHDRKKLPIIIIITIELPGVR